MSTYPGEDPQTPAGQQPTDEAASGVPIEPTGPASPDEPTQPLGYWERQAAEEHAQSGRADQGPYGQAPDAAPYGAHPAYPQQPQQPYGGGGMPYSAPANAQPSWYPPAPGQPAYPPPPGAPGYGGGYAAQPDHPQATLAMVLGLVGLIGGLFVCGLPLLVSPVAWVIGRNAVKDIEASQGRLGGDGMARAGMIMGIVGTVLLILAILAVIAFVVAILLGASTGTSTGSSV